MKLSALSISNLSVSYNDRPILSNINIEIPYGILLAVIGPNGAGKTTLLKSITGLIKPLSGTIRVNGSNKFNNMSIAYIPQRSTIDWDFPVTALDVVLMGTYSKVGWFKRPGKIEKEQSLKALKQVGALLLADKPINELSGGQQQRVFLARALCQNASLYLMDEPFVGIDMETEEMIVKLLKQLRSSGKTIIVVHHDLNTLGSYFDNALIVSKTNAIYRSITQIALEKSLYKKDSSDLTITTLT